MFVSRPRSFSARKHRHRRLERLPGDEALGAEAHAVAPDERAQRLALRGGEDRPPRDRVDRVRDHCCRLACASAGRSSKPCFTTSCFTAFTSSSRPTGCECGASWSSSGSSRGLARDGLHRVGELVERLLRLGLRRLDHQRLRHDEREVDRRRMEPVVHQPLCDVERGHAVLALQRSGREDELVHAEPVVRKVVRVAEQRQQVVRVDDGHLGHLAQPGPVGPDVRVRADEDAERARESAHLADRLRPLRVEREAVAVADDLRHGQVRLEHVANRDRPAARARRRRAAARTSCGG